jgi:hypothetical protein
MLQYRIHNLGLKNCYYILLPQNDTILEMSIVNRVKQDLAWQFPEAAKIRLTAPLFWGWLAGLRPSARYDNLLTWSIGLGLTVETQLAAKSICELQERERILELSMRQLISDPRFNAYRRVFARFGFGQRVEALILSQIYPLENYLLNGKPEIRIRKGKVSGKSTKRELSRRRFQKALGVALAREESGDKKSTRKAGSALCRMALRQWIFTRIEIVKLRPKNDIGKKLGEMLDYEKAHKPVKLARSRVAAKAAAMLFKELVASIDADCLQHQI